MARLCAPSACRFSICLRLACTKLDANALARPSKILAAADADRLLRGLSARPRPVGVEPSGLAFSEPGAPLERHLRAEFGLRFFRRCWPTPPIPGCAHDDRPDRMPRRTAAIPQLMEIAAGDTTSFAIQFVRIKAIAGPGPHRALDAPNSFAPSQPVAMAWPMPSPPACVRPLRCPGHVRGSSQSARAARLLPHPAVTQHQLLVQRRYCARSPSNRRSVRADLNGKRRRLARVNHQVSRRLSRIAKECFTVGDSIKLEVRSPPQNPTSPR